ncbi:YcaO-like family protein [Pseudomonas sp. FP198]|uniref:YcaO-like family protein n=1 Tax=Pseudomonas sp. FP198 TaxID=2954084 RepID=UPI00273662E1|nr:YcaO-like family protein [Pseudomonas sp. FP198]WLG97914.1 YcaO-like family protein [Pseudomonas sp. FP198]
MSERELTAPEALFNIMSTLHALDFRAEARYTTPSRLVATAEIFDGDNNFIQSGAGKGPDALIGALAESIEHYSTFQTHESTWHQTDDIATQEATSHDGFFIGLPRSEEPIDCFTLTSLDKKEKLIVPSALLCPAVAQNISDHASPTLQFLSRYSSNSGIAFGCTENEALLHGIQEVIERHVLSRFFMAVCGIGPNMQLYNPSKGLLAKALLNNSSALEPADELQIIIVKDVFSVYFAVAFPKAGPGDQHLSPIGSGCSLDICIAIQRAVTEQFQSRDLYDVFEESTDRKTFNLLSRSDKLKNLIDLAPVKTLKLPELDCPSHGHTESVSTQLETLHNVLSGSGKKIFHRTVARYPKNSTVAQAYIPGLERFNIIRNGRLVVPQHILRNC